MSSPKTCYNEDKALFKVGGKTNAIPRTISPIDGVLPMPIINSMTSKCKSGTRLLGNGKTINVESCAILWEKKRKLTQQALQNKCTGVVEKGRMLEAQYNKIRKNYTALLQQIVKPRDMCRELFSASVFDEEDKKYIESEKDRIEQTDKLLMTLVNRGPSAFDKFLLALSATGHHQAKQILEQEACEDDAAVRDTRYHIMKIKIEDPNGDRFDILKDNIEKAIKDCGCGARVISVSSSEDK